MKSVLFLAVSALLTACTPSDFSIKGNAGVYMVRVSNKQVAEGELNAEQEISNLNMRTSYSLPYQAISLMEEKAEVEDNRARFQ
jgi:hypothetical protein